MANLRKAKPRVGTLVLVVTAALLVPASVMALTLVGTPKPDLLRGSKQGDKVFGLGANDRLYGFAGNDLIVGGPGKDKMYGGTGNDRLEARDGQRDLVDCGPGNDTAVVDSIDQVVSCEHVQRPGRCQGCRSNPIGIGVSHDVGRGWAVKVVSVLPNATTRILQFDRSNSPPRPNFQFFMVTIQAKRTGKDPGYLHAGYYMRAVGPSGHEYSTFDDSCGSLPDPDLEIDDRRIFPNASVTGNICWEVRSSDAPRLVMISAPGKQVYFALSG
jgi:hypothetical protein